MAKRKRRASTAVPTPAAVSQKEQRRYQAEDDLRTLGRAEEIRKDSGRMRVARRVAKQQLREVSRTVRMIGGRR